MPKLRQLTCHVDCVSVIPEHRQPAPQTWRGVWHFAGLEVRLKVRLATRVRFDEAKHPAARCAGHVRRATLGPVRLDAAIGEWLAARHVGGWCHIALDGKVLRGSRDGNTPGTHLLAAYAPRAVTVIAQMSVEATTNEHKAALRLLGALPPLHKAVVTADAMVTHADFREAVLDKGGDYVLYATGNQPDLLDDIRAAFDSAEGGDFSPQQQQEWDADAESASTRGQGHGRSETRVIATTTWLNDYRRDWPGSGQVFRLRRSRTHKG